MQLAQSLQLPGATGIIQGPLNRNPSGPQFPNLASVVGNAIQFIFPIAGVILLAFLVWGGFDYLTSMGDPKKAEAARGKITNAILGFVIIFFAYWIVQILDYIFKLGIYTPTK